MLVTDKEARKKYVLFCRYPFKLRRIARARSVGFGAGQIALVRKKSRKDIAALLESPSSIDKWTF